MDTSEDQGHPGPSGLSRGARGDVDHDQNDVHFRWELRRDQGWRPIGSPRFLRDAGRLACVAQVSQSGVSHLWSSCLQLHHQVWPHPWRLPIQDRQSPQLFQLHTALESGNEEVARHAGREANRHRVRHGAHDANGLQALRDWWGHPLARLDLEPPDDQRIWYEIRRILLHQPCLRQPQESLSRGPETGEGRVWSQWHPPQPHGHADGECSAELRGHQRAHWVWQAAPLFQTRRHSGGEKHRHPGGWAGIRFSAGAWLHRLQRWPPWRALMHVDFSVMDGTDPVVETGIEDRAELDLSCNSRTSPTTRSKTPLRCVAATRYADTSWWTGIWNVRGVSGKWNPWQMPTSPLRLPAGRRWPVPEACPSPWTRWSSTTLGEAEWPGSRRRDLHLLRPPSGPEAPMATWETWPAIMSDLSRKGASKTLLTDSSATHSFSSMRRIKTWCRRHCSSSSVWLAVWVRPLSAPRLRFLEKSLRWPPSWSSCHRRSGSPTNPWIFTPRCLCRIGASFSTLASSQSMWRSSSSRSKDPYPLFMAGATVTSCQMRLMPKRLQKSWWSSASCNGRTMPPNKRTRSLIPPATTGRSVYLMQVGPLVDLSMNDPITSNSSQTLASLLAEVLTVKARVQKVTTKAEDRQRGRDSRRERASKAEAHREVWPMVTLKEIPTGFRAIATHGTGTNSEAGTGAGPELRDDSHWRLGHIFLFQFACREACLSMTNLAGIAPIEHTKALTQIMHYPIQANFNAQISVQFEWIKFYVNDFSSHTIGCSRQDSNRFTLFMAVQFSCHGILLEWHHRNGIVPSFHLKMPGGSHGHAVCNFEPNTGAKGICEPLHSPDIALTSARPMPICIRPSCVALNFSVHSGLFAAAYCRHSYTGAAKQLQYTGGIFTG